MPKTPPLLLPSSSTFQFATHGAPKPMISPQEVLALRSHHLPSVTEEKGDETEDEELALTPYESSFQTRSPKQYQREHILADPQNYQHERLSTDSENYPHERILADPQNYQHEHLLADPESYQRECTLGDSQNYQPQRLFTDHENYQHRRPSTVNKDENQSMGSSQPLPEESPHEEEDLTTSYAMEAVYQELVDRYAYIKDKLDAEINELRQAEADTQMAVQELSSYNKTMVVRCHVVRQRWLQIQSDSLDILTTSDSFSQ